MKFEVFISSIKQRLINYKMTESAELAIEYVLKVKSTLAERTIINGKKASEMNWEDFVYGSKEWLNKSEVRVIRRGSDGKMYIERMTGMRWVELIREEMEAFKEQQRKERIVRRMMSPMHYADSYLRCIKDENLDKQLKEILLKNI